MPNRNRSRGRPRSVVLALVAAVLLVGCGPTTKQAAPTPTGASTPRFTAQTVSGETVKIPGDKPAVVLFFSVECGSCGPTAHALAQVQARDPRAADFAVVDIAPNETPADVKGFLRDNDANSLAYTVDTDGRLFRSYRVTQLTTVLIIDADGRVAYRAVEPTAATIRAELAKVATG